MSLEHDCEYTIMDGPVIRFGFGFDVGSHTDVFSRKKVKDWSAEISASRNGVSLSGHFPCYKDRTDIEELKRLLEFAFNAHLAIGGRGDHDAAKEWVNAYNASLTETVAALRAITKEHGLNLSLDDLNELRDE